MATCGIQLLRIRWIWTDSYYGSVHKETEFMRVVSDMSIDLSDDGVLRSRPYTKDLQPQEDWERYDIRRASRTSSNASIYHGAAC